MGYIPHFGLYSIFFWVMGYIQFGLYSIWVVYPILIFMFVSVHMVTSMMDFTRASMMRTEKPPMKVLKNFQKKSLRLIKSFAIGR